MRPLGNAAELERRRIRAVQLVVKSGLTQVEAAKRVGVVWRTVAKWLQRYRQDRKLGLAPRPTPGRPCRLDEKKKKKLEQLLLKGAQVVGFETDLWTCSRVAQAMHRLLGIEYHPDHVSRLLRSMGWSPQRSERRAKERNERRIRR